MYKPSSPKPQTLAHLKTFVNFLCNLQVVKTVSFKVPYMPVHKTQFFPSNFCLKVGVCLLHAMDFFKFKNAFKSSDIDPKCRYFRHPVYGYVMVKLLLRDVMVFFACT